MPTAFGIAKTQGDSELKKGRGGNFVKNTKYFKRTNERHQDKYMIT